jgi:hypothetical protein
VPWAAEKLLPKFSCLPIKLKIQQPAQPFVKTAKKLKINTQYKNVLQTSITPLGGKQKLKTYVATDLIFSTEQQKFTSSKRGMSCTWSQFH